MSEHYPFAKVLPLHPNAIQSQNRPALDVIQNLKWDYKSRYGRFPIYVILGGNPLRRAVQELYDNGIIPRNGLVIQSLCDMVLVRVKHDCMEVGE